MKYKPNIGFEKFKEIYKEKLLVHPMLYNIKEIGINKYKFSVQLIYKNKNGIENRIERYKTVMEVIDGKVKTISVKRIYKEIVERISYGNKEAYIKWENGVYKVYLKTNGVKKIVYKCIPEGGWMREVQNLNFINDGKILVMEESGYEFYSLNFYNVKNSNLIQAISVNKYGITKDGKYMYICSVGGMWPDLLKIYNVEDLSLYENIKSYFGKKEVVTKCTGYDANSNTFKYSVGNFMEDYNYMYDFNSNKITKIK
ncbi:hypothetical protein CSB07_00095 [Candidatus Gracilibacteria bacterium]|nr:MAG: hypothetical protein CSB07_00095 [Candidatus Gracilibacteria bacterium]PIE85677.1 MAG: hypothetical protein CSA08_00840 [Candidatus Gracilibacteria bacterium]